MILLAGCTAEPLTSELPPEVPGLVASSEGDVTVGYPDVAIDADGRVWVTWTQVDGDEVADVLLSWSDDRGRTFAPPVVVDDVSKLFLGSVRQPVLAVSDDRVAVTVGGGDYRVSSILLYVASTADPRTFTSDVLDSAELGISQPGTTVTLVDQPEVVFDPSGQLRVSWKQGTKDESYALIMGLESDDFAPVRIDDHTQGEPCECCPVDLQVYPDGETQLLFRNNRANIRDVYLLDAPGPDVGPFERAAAVSTTHWDVGGCPFDGPVMAASDDALVAAWVDGTEGDNYAFVATSADRGQTWTENRRLFPDNDESQTWPSAAVDEQGGFWFTVEEIYHQTRLGRSVDGGASFQEVPIGDDAGPLFQAEVAAGDGRVGLVGVDADHDLWYVEGFAGGVE